MARGRRKTVLEVELPEGTESLGEGAPEGRTVEELESESILEDVRSEQPKHPLEIVYRADEDTGEEGWVGKFAATSVTPEFLSKRFGPGKYKCYTRKPDKNGKMGFGGSRVLNVVADLRTPVQQGAPVVRGERESGDFSRDLLISMMKQGQENSANMVTMMATMMSAMTTAMTSLKPTADPMMLTIMQSLMTRKDPTEIATALLGVMRENGGGAAKDPIEMLTRLLELQELLPKGGGNTDDPTAAWIGKGIEAVGKLAEMGRPAPVQRVIGPAQLPVQGQPVPAAVAAPAPAPVALPQPEIDPNMRPWKKLVAENLPVLLSASAFLPPNAAALTAKTNLEADGLWADVVADVRSDYPVLDMAAELPDDFGDAFVARALVDFKLPDGPQKEWARETLSELAYLAVEPEEEEEEKGDDEKVNDGATDADSRE